MRRVAALCIAVGLVAATGSASASATAGALTCIRKGTHLVGCLRREPDRQGSAWYSNGDCNVQLWGHPSDFIFAAEGFRGMGGPDVEKGGLGQTMALRPRRAFFGAIGLASLVLVTTACTTTARAARHGQIGGPVTTIKLPAPVARIEPGLNSMVAGIGGTMWIATYSAAAGSGIVLAGPSGIVKRFRSGRGWINGLATMSDGSVWYTSDGSTVVGRISLAGAVSRFPTGLPLTPRYDLVGTVAPGSNGVVWFDAGEGRIVELASDGRVLHVYRPLGAYERMLTADAAGHVWLTTPSGPHGAVTLIAQMAADGSILWQTAIPGIDFGVNPYALAGDGSLWVLLGGGLGRIASDGRLTHVTISEPPQGALGLPFSGEIVSMAFDGAGTLWFATPDPPAVGAIAPGGAVTIYPQLDHPVSLAFDSGGGLWFAGDSALVLRTAPPPPSVCVVPDLYGDRLADAQATIQSDTTCTVGAVRGTKSGTVWGQSPAPDTHLPGGSGVGILLGQGRPGLPGTWKGNVTTDQCTANGGSTPSGTLFAETLRVKRGTNGQLTAVIGGSLFRLTHHHGASYSFAGRSASQTLSIHDAWPSVSIVLATPGGAGCGDVLTYGDLYRTADA